MPVHPKVLAAIAQPVDYPDVNLSVLAAYNLAGMKSAGGSVNDDTGETTGDDPRDLIQGEIIRGIPYTATDMAYFEYIGWGPKMSPYRWHGETSTFTFDATLLGQPNLGYAITQIPMPVSAPAAPPRPNPLPSPTTNGTPQGAQIIATGGGSQSTPGAGKRAGSGYAVTQDAKGNMFTHFGATVHEAITNALAWIEAAAKKL